MSFRKVLGLIPDAESARLYLESRLWANGAVCPTCGSHDRITVRKGGFYRCNHCKLDFTVRTGTIFERSHVPLHKWIYAMYLVVTARKEITSVQLAREIGITQKSAWFVLHRLREACAPIEGTRSGIVALDGLFLTGKEGNKPQYTKRNLGQGGARKAAGSSVRGRGGRTVAMKVADRDKARRKIEICPHEICPDEICPDVETRAALMRNEDREHPGESGRLSQNATIDLGGGAHTRVESGANSFERVWAHLKRAICGAGLSTTESNRTRRFEDVIFRSECSFCEPLLSSSLHLLIDCPRSLVAAIIR